jgi:16S rRNA (cytidine1402-2'-O)-methyltransferase
MKNCLYLVATPIGNLEDITLRAIEILKKVDLIACEDTRTTNRLLSHYGIKKKLISIHQHNEKSKTEFLINELANGKSIAYASDAGTPAISDPGAFLVKQALKFGIKVSPIPGPSSLIAAFSVSGIETTQFQFYGFIPNASSKAKKLLQKIYGQTLPTIIFESPHRVLKTLSLVRNIFGPKHKIFIARELTKIYETIYKDDVTSIIERLESHPEEQKGEFVIILTPPIKEIENNETIAISEALKLMMKELPLNQSVKLISSIFKKNKKEVYNQALELKND